MTLRATSFLRRGVERKPLTCKTCNNPYWITHSYSGCALVQPGEWFRPTSQRWEAICQCEREDGSLRLIRRDTEWALYKALGCTVAA